MYKMGNAVLMPEFYGIGINKLPRIDDRPQNKAPEQSVQVRKLTYRSTYDDQSQSSIFSRQKYGSTYVQSLSKRQSKPQDILINTKESFTSSSFSFMGDNQKGTQQILVRQQQQNAADQDPFAQGKNTSIIDKVLELEDTESEKQAIREKCQKFYEMGEKLWRKGEFQKSVGYLEQVLRQSGARYPDSQEQKAKLYSLLGSSYLRLGVYDKSADCYHKALQILNKAEDVSNCANVHLSLGTIYQKTNHLDEAIEHLDASYALKKSQLSENAPELLSALQNLATLQVQRANHVKAIARLTEIMAINRSLYGSKHLEVARTYFYLSLSLFQIREYSMWLQYHYECIRMMKELELQNLPDYKQWLKMFKDRLVQLINIKRHAEEVIEKSVQMAQLLLSEDEQIDFLSKIKDNLESSVVDQSEAA